MIFFTVFILIIALILSGIFFGIRGLVRLIWGGGSEKPAETPKPLSWETVLSDAERLAASYDYDAAIELIKAQPDYQNNESLSSAVTRFEGTKATMVPANIQEVTHVFFHTLIKDNQKAFDGEYTEDGYNQYMTTISEFEAMLRLCTKEDLCL